jgi:UDP-N-acetylmuramate dehydrogenase
VHDGRPDLADYTTLRLGGPARRVVEATTESDIRQIIRDVDDRRDLLILAGGSNVVIGDAGFDGTALLLRTQGLTVQPVGAALDTEVDVTVQAGEPWDDLVARTLAEGWSGLECLSGIPGSTGATPIQNVGAYGQEVAELITAVRVLDRATGEIGTRTVAECGLGYRTSVFKGSDRWVVLAVTFRLSVSPLSAPIRYADLAQTLAVPIGERSEAAVVRDAVLRLRAGKGMVLDDGDPDTYSAGSFFMNPVLDGAAFDTLSARAAAYGSPPVWPGADDTVKTSAAWLIERAGFAKGYGNPHVSISTKHTLALTNRGDGTTKELLELAREVRDGVFDRFGVLLHPEPVLINCAL